MKRKKKYIQKVPGISSKKRFLASASVVGLSLSAVIGFCPFSVRAEAIDFESAAVKSDMQIRHIEIVEENDNESDTVYAVEKESTEEVAEPELSSFFTEEEITKASVKNEETTIDVQAVLKKAAEEKAEAERIAKEQKAAKERQMSNMSIPEDIEFDENGLPTNYSYCLEGRASAYCCGTTTATGTHVHQGTVAVNPSQIPYGTKMYIVSADGKYVYGYCRAEDTGGFVYNGSGRIADLYMSSYSDCINFGVRNVKIYVF